MAYLIVLGILAVIPLALWHTMKWLTRRDLAKAEAMIEAVKPDAKAEAHAHDPDFDMEGRKLSYDAMLHRTAVLEGSIHGAVLSWSIVLHLCACERAVSLYRHCVENEWLPDFEPGRGVKRKRRDPAIEYHSGGPVHVVESADGQVIKTYATPEAIIGTVNLGHTADCMCRGCMAKRRGGLVPLGRTYR